MVSYNYFREEIIKIAGNYGGKEVESTEDDVIVEFSNSSSSEVKGSIKNCEIRDLYDRASKIKSEDFGIYSTNYYEIAVVSSAFDDTYVISFNDEINNIEYRVGDGSFDYKIFLLSKIITQSAYNNNVPLKIKLKRKSRFEEYLYLLRNCNEGNLKSFINGIIDVTTLRISVKESTHLEQLKEYKTAFLFECMYNYGTSVVEVNRIDDLYGVGFGKSLNKDISKIEIIPRRKYIADIVDYYKMAVSATDPYIQYISYYHAMEYFFDEVFRERLVEALRDKLTEPDFSYKDDNSVYSLAEYVNKNWKINEESGKGDEKASLKYVLEEYVDIEQLKKRITEISVNAVDYYAETEVPFCKASIISWNDRKGVYSTISNRIYITRNSLVHSKSSERLLRYRPYKDEGDLQLEIPLVKAVAEIIIVNTGTIM